MALKRRWHPPCACHLAGIEDKLCPWGSFLAALHALPLPQTMNLRFMAVFSLFFFYHKLGILFSWQYSRRWFSTPIQHSAFLGSNQIPFFGQSNCQGLHLSLLWQRSIEKCTARIAKFQFCGRIPTGFILPQVYFFLSVVETVYAPYCHNCAFHHS